MEKKIWSCVKEASVSVFKMQHEERNTPSYHLMLKDHDKAAACGALGCLLQHVAVNPGMFVEACRCQICRVWLVTHPPVE